MPTGSGKTRLAIAWLAEQRIPSLVLAPTRALVEQWRVELARWYAGPIGVVSDGDRQLEDVTVMTFASGYRSLDRWGDRFGAVVVDEAHHFASGSQSEALEMCVAHARLGLTATAPAAASHGAERLATLIGPVICEIDPVDLIGTHLSPLTRVRIGVNLTPREWAEYGPAYARFAELRAAFFRATPEADYAQCLRALARTESGREAIRDYHRAAAIASLPSAKRETVTRLLARHARERTLVFTATAEDAYVVARDNLVPVITAEIGRAERTEVLSRYRDGRFRTIVSARVLNEGIDVPDAAIAILVAGTLGRREYIQRIGRVLRPAPGKNATVYELVATGTLDDDRVRNREARRAS
jgi:superfamily II DNA or RNA helicase